MVSKWLDIFADLTLGEGATLIFISALVVTAAWNFYHFLRRNEYFPKIEFFADLLFKDDLGDNWLAEVVCVVRNRGVSGHKARNLTFRVHGFADGDPMKTGDADINGQVRFEHLVVEGSWKNRARMNDRVEPGTSQFYRHVAAIPKRYRCIIVHGRMEYDQRSGLFGGRRVTHTCSRMLRLPATIKEADMYAENERVRLVLSSGDFASARMA